MKMILPAMFIAILSTTAYGAVPTCQYKMKALVIQTYNRISQISKIGPTIDDLKASDPNDTDNDGTPLVEYKGSWFVAKDTDGDFIPGSEARLLVRKDRCEIVSIEVRIRGPN